MNPRRELPARWMCALVFAVTLAAYWPALHGALLWDDAGHVTRAELRSLGGLYRIWFEPGATQQFYPFLHSAFWLEHKLWGDATLGYHLVNVLLHATAACLFATLLRRLLTIPSARSELPVAWLAALLFALHPVCVESVAWISEQKNTLSLVLYLCAAFAYLRFDDARERMVGGLVPVPAWRRVSGPLNAGTGTCPPTTEVTENSATKARWYYFVATALFACALFTKTVTASLPAALLVVFWWQRGRLDLRRDIVPLLPWFALAAAAGLVTAWFESTLIGASGADFSLGPAERVLLAGRVIWFYLGKLVWPADLAFIYPRWRIDAGETWQFLFPVAALTAVVVLAWLARRRRGPLAVFLLFCGSLFPALGFVNVYPFLFSWVADHFQYLPSLAVFAAIAAGLMRLPRAVPVVVLAILAALTWRQSVMYRDPFTLYETTLAKNPTCWMAHNNLAEALTAAGRPADALPHLEAALKLRPDFPEGENNLGDNLRRLGRNADALPHLEKALRLRPTFAQAHNNLGIVLMNLGRDAEGLAHFEQAARLQPKFALAHFNLGLALATTGRPADALPHFERALQIDPAYAEAELNLAIGLTLTNRFPTAEPHFERALQLDPDSVAAHMGYGRALATVGRFDAAVSHLRTALDLAPASAEAHLTLAQTLQQMGQTTEANAHLAEAQRLRR